MAQFGSFINQISGSNPAVVPVVGMGATACGWSDRHPYTVVEVRSPTTIVVQEDNYKRTDCNGMSESQTYIFTPNPEAEKVVVTRRKNGQWVQKGCGMKGCGKFIIGSRDKYYDYSF